MTSEWIRAERAITGDGTTVLSPVWIGIEGQIIKEIGSEKPAGANDDHTRDLGDMTLTPGLFNLHDHISRKWLRDTKSPLSFSQRSKVFMQEDSHFLLLHSVANIKKALEEGITYIRDYGLAGYTSIHLRRAVNEGLVDGPELSACGRPICMTGGHTYRQAHEVDGPEAVRAAVREEIKLGADIIKFMASGGLEHFPQENPKVCELTVDEMRAGAEAARETGAMTSAHAYPARAVLNVVQAGVDVVEHGVMMDDECIEAMVKAGTPLVPTLTGLRGVARFLPDTPEGEQTRALLQERIYGPHDESIRMAAKAGILVGTGTDTSGRLADEIRLIQGILDCGPVQALAHGSSISAKIIRRDDLGLLAEGKIANIAAFPGDLTRSLENLDRAVHVWKYGRKVV